LASLLLDECMAWGVSRMRRRAARTGRFAGLVAPIDDLIGQRIMATGWFEATQIEAVQRLIDDPDFIGFQLRPNGALVDVGANIGLYSIAFARCFQRVLAIEANPTTFAVLQANMALKQLSQVACVCAAASDRAGEAVLHVPENGNLGWATLEHRPETKRTAQAVSCRSLDDIVREHLDGQRVALVKIDVEGHERRCSRAGAACSREIGRSFCSRSATAAPAAARGCCGPWAIRASCASGDRLVRKLPRACSPAGWACAPNRSSLRTPSAPP
jgi:FkbM family methyltransferase